ncbi:MAG: DUF4364 family protein [Christensenellaceae bacterium]|jgi:hypothetical protein|nr:DUF4364 family protein [Christensenellaceae bacterium]
MLRDETVNNKLLVLFVMEKLEMPISEETLVQICAIDNTWISQLFCSPIIRELITGGFLTETKIPVTKANILALSPDGVNCLSHFYNDIAASLREEITAYVRKERINFKKKQEFLADYRRNSDGTFTVILKILDITKPIMELKFIVTNRAVATSIYNSWQIKAHEVYIAISDTLLDA